MDTPDCPDRLLRIAPGHRIPKGSTPRRSTTAEMKVVGLLSGGKDSVYNLVHCVVQGHEPIAVASLGPPEGKGASEAYAFPIRTELTTPT